MMMRVCVWFVALMVCGLVFQTITYQPGGRPEDDPTNGTFVRQPVTQAIVDHRDEWRAALDKAYAEDGDTSWNSENARRYEWMTANWPYPNKQVEADIKAWRQVYDEWEWEQSKANWIKTGGPLPSAYRRESYR